MVRYELTLIVSGASDISARAITQARRICDQHVDGDCHLTVSDIHAARAAGLGDGVLATPTLVKHHPLPSRRVVGDLADIAEVMTVLDLPAVHAHPEDA